jgi:hypothetical protein
MEKIKREYYCLVLAAVGFVLSSFLIRNAQSTLSTTFWAPSTPYLQPFDKTKAQVPEGWIWTLQLDVDIDLKGGK